jgi:hypothetical protein
METNGGLRAAKQEVNFRFGPPDRDNFALQERITFCALPAASYLVQSRGGRYVLQNLTGRV